MKARGFTLIEVLVVIVLLGLMTFLLMQTMSQVMFLRFRFVSHLESLQVGRVQEHWYRQIVSSVITGLPAPASTGSSTSSSTSPKVFKGDEKKFSAMILNPLSGFIGAPTQIQMQIDQVGGKIQLTYSEGATSLVLGAWNADKAKLSYLDKKGEWKEEWPPMGRVPQLTPYGILFEVNDAAGPILWFASVQQRHSPWTEKQSGGMME